MPNPRDLPSSVEVALLRDYEVLRYVARGSFGMVFSGVYSPPPLAGPDAATSSSRTDSPPSKIPVAIKVIKDYLCGLDPVTLEEVKVVALPTVGGLNDPHPQGTTHHPPLPQREHFSDRYRSVYIKRIVRELQILRYFNGCYEFIELIDAYFSQDGRDLYLVMPFVSHSARSLLSATSKSQARAYARSVGSYPKEIPSMGLPEDVVRVIMVQLLSGLQKMERAGCGHRDLTASNILIDGDSLYTFLCDFGLSRAHMAAEDNMTLEVVTQPYRAPELLFQCAKYDHAIDIWSAGIVMFELLTGRPPIVEKDVPRQLLHVLELVTPGGVPDLEYWRAKGARDSALRYIQMKIEQGTITRNTTSLTANRDPFIQHGLIRSTLQSLRTGKHLLEYDDGVALAAYFAQEPLSIDGLEVLETLLHEKPDHRKNFEEVLKMKWFQGNLDCREQLDVMSKKLPSAASEAPTHSSVVQPPPLPLGGGVATVPSTTTYPPPRNIEKMTLKDQVNYLRTELVSKRAVRVVSISTSSEQSR